MEANATAHAVWGAIAAASGNNSALAGAAGAVSGELLGRWIAAEYYPDVKTEELSDEQKSTISALSTLAAGLMGGLSGGSSGDAVTGAQAGKNAVENNLLGGNEWTQGEKAREHGANVFSCTDNPSGEACKKGIAENKAYAGVLATGGLVYLPGGMQMTAAIGGSANAGFQYILAGEINPADVLIASYVGALTANTGFLGTVGWNATGGATSSWLKDGDPLMGAGVSGIGAGIGYGAGKLISLGSNKWGYVRSDGFDPKYNLKLQGGAIHGQLGLSKDMKPAQLPGALGNMGASATTEGSNYILQEGLKKIEEKVDDNKK